MRLRLGRRRDGSLSVSVDMHSFDAWLLGSGPFSSTEWLPESSLPAATLPGMGQHADQHPGRSSTVWSLDSGPFSSMEWLPWPPQPSHSMKDCIPSKSGEPWSQAENSASFIQGSSSPSSWSLSLPLPFLPFPLPFPLPLAFPLTGLSLRYLAKMAL